MDSNSSNLPSGKAEVSSKSSTGKRRNVVMGALVELGIKLSQHKSVSVVARFLATAGVPMRVVTRVLLRPDLRRNLKRRGHA